MEHLVLFVHLFGALLLGGGVGVAGVAVEAARRRETPGEVALLLGLTPFGRDWADIDLPPGC